MKNSYLCRICKAVMFVMCLSIVIYMARKEIARFWENKDTSTVSIKRFHKQRDENGNFPTFSICFQYGYVMFDSKEFQNNGPKTNKDHAKNEIQKYDTTFKTRKVCRPYAKTRFPHNPSYHCKP